MMEGVSLNWLNYVLLTASNHCCCPADEMEIEQEAAPSSKPEVSLSALLPAAASGTASGT